MAKANRWVDFIRKWAKDNDTTYSCALSNPKCKDAYRAKYGVRKGVPAKTERERMGLEDVNRAAKPKPTMSFKDRVEEVIRKAKASKPKKKLRIVEDDVEFDRPEEVREQVVVAEPPTKKKKRRPPADRDETEDNFRMWMKAAEDERQRQIVAGEKGYFNPRGGKKGAKAIWRSTKKGIQKGLDETAGVLNMINPVYQMNTRAPEVGAVMGELSYNYALPAMVSMGYYAYIAAAESAATMMGLPPQVGKEAAEILWDEMVVKQGYDPRERQKSQFLGNVADSTGRLAFGGSFYRL